MSSLDSRIPHQPLPEITLGWEIEFIVYSDDGEPAGRDIKDKKLHELASSIVVQAPALPVAAECRHLPNVTCDVCQDAHREFRIPGLRVFTPAQPMFHGISEYLYFFLLNAHVPIDKPEYGSSVPYPFEVASPVFNDEELQAGLPKTAQLVSALRNSEIKIMAHTGCGLHFHVGVKSGMALDIAKKVSTLTMLLEFSLFAAFVPLERVTERYFSPIIRMSKFADDAREEENGTFDRRAREKLLTNFPIPASQLQSAEWNEDDPGRWYLTLIYIWQAKNLSSLAEGLLNIGNQKNSLALSLRDERGILESLMGRKAFPNDSDKTQSTIEFRYPPMSFDTEYIKNWAEIVCKVVEIATRDAPAFSQVTESLFYEFQRTGVDNGLEMWARLLTVLELGHRIDYWRPQLLRFEDGEPIRFLDLDGFVLPETQ
ncbi:hypothetical protein ACHAQJ_003782 [Trichoderma viride]